MDVRSMRGSSGISDHYIVKTKVKIRLSIKWKERKALVKKLNIEQLKNPQTTEQCKNRLNYTLRTVEEKSSIDDMWEKREKSVKKIAEEVLGFQGKQSINKWFNKERKTAIVKNYTVRTIMLRDPGKANKQELALKQREAKQIIRKNKRMWEKARIETIENSYKNSIKLFFGRANDIKNGFKPRSTIMKDDERNLITVRKEVTKEFKKVFEKILNVSTQTETNNDDVTTIDQYLEDPHWKRLKWRSKCLREERHLEKTQ
jgi:hypothetical protein|uniref:Craniofacial development protein 2 n=1 Tax=Sipha flava TaxID=143950 RepID=A0A2S2R9E9_9HEMI